MSSEIADLIRRFQRDWKVSTEPVFWGYPQVLRQVPHTFIDFDFADDLLHLRCRESAAVLSVWSPRGVAINEYGFRIADAQRVRWEWQVQGAPKTPPMLYFKEFWRTEEDVSGKSNSHWSPREVGRRIDKGKAAVLWPGCLTEQPVGTGTEVQPALWRARACSWLYGIAVASLLFLWAYIFYSDVTQTGFMGHLFAFEVHTLGVADTALNMVLGLFAVSVPPVLLFRAAVRLERKAPLPQKTGSLPVLPTLLALLLIGLTTLFLHDRNLKLYSIDLSAPSVAIPHDAGFVEVKATVVQGVRSGYYSNSGKSTHEHSYQPLVGPGWTPHDPIHCFLFSIDRAYGFRSLWSGRSPAMEVVSASVTHPQFERSSLSEFHGKVQAGLPVIVRQDYEAKGFTVAPDCIVIERAYISNHKVSVWNRYDNLLIIGFVVGILPVMYWLSKVWSWIRRAA